MTTTQRGWKSRIVGHDEIPAESITPNPLNWRAHPGLQRAALTGVLYEVGWVQDVVINQRTGNLIDGHLRVDLARAKGELVPVVYVDLSDEEERLVLATLDPLAALATTDQEALRELLLQVSTSDESLADMLAKLGATAEAIGDGMVEGEDYDSPVIGFSIEVVVTTPEQRDRVSESITALGLTPHVRTVRRNEET